MKIHNEVYTPNWMNHCSSIDFLKKKEIACRWIKCDHINEVIFKMKVLTQMNCSKYMDGIMFTNDT
jgi:hypothetical protein